MGNSGNMTQKRRARRRAAENPDGEEARCRSKENFWQFMNSTQNQEGKNYFIDF